MVLDPYQGFRVNGEPTHYGEIFTQPGFDIHKLFRRCDATANVGKEILCKRL